MVDSSRDLDRLGSLLEQRLPRLAVVNPLQLSAGALVQALRPGPQLARFEVNGEAFEVHDMSLEDHRFQRPVRLEEPGEGLGDLLGVASLISPTELGAEVAVATAFGERVEGVWRIRGQNLLQVRYRLNAHDTLVGRTVARHLGVAPAEAAALMRGSRHLRLPVDPDSGVLLQRDLQHQGISARLEPGGEAFAAD